MIRSTESGTLTLKAVQQELFGRDSVDLLHGDLGVGAVQLVEARCPDSRLACLEHASRFLRNAAKRANHQHVLYTHTKYTPPTPSRHE